MRRLRFCFDVVCPFACVASTHIRDLAREAGLDLELEPVLLGGLYQVTGGPQEPEREMAPAKARLTRLDALRQAQRAGFPLRYPDAHPRRTVSAMRLLQAVEPERRWDLVDALYRAYWVEGRDVADLDTLSAIGAPFGLDAAAVNADPIHRQALRDRTAAAAARGVFGVPTTELLEGDRVVGSWWGADRLAMVRRALGLPDARVADLPWATDRSPRDIAFFHDLSSPFSYLASTRIAPLEAETGSRVEPVPILVGALFQQIGTPLVPIRTFSEARQAWVRRDLDAWADRWGVPFRWPSRFPYRTVTALRAVIVEPRLTAPLYRAGWVEDRDLSEDAVVREVAEEAGVDGAALLEATRNPEVKAQLFANTGRAVASGVCGVPSFLVGGEHLFWGQDRLDHVRDAARGWQAPADPTARATLGA